MSDTGLPKVNVSLNAETDGEPEVDISDEEFLQFDTSSVPVIVTLTKVCVFVFRLSNFYALVPRKNNRIV